MQTKSHDCQLDTKTTGLFWMPTKSNRAWQLVFFYVLTPRPVLSLYGIIYVTWYT